jgi:hypothetical protein
MRTRTGRRISLGVGWSGSGWDRAPAVVEALLPLLRDMPIHWNLPAFPAGRAGGPAEVADRIRPRLGAARDQVVPAGYAGAPHPLLALDELEKELGWGLKNPWSTGVGEVLGSSSPFLLPRLADTRREGAIQAYLKAGFRSVGLWRPAGHGAFARDGVCFFPCTRLAHGSLQDLSGAVRRMVSRSAGAFLVLDAASFPEPAAASAFLGEVLSVITACGAEVSPLQPPAEAAPEAQEEGQDWHAFSFPALRGALEAAAAQPRRKKRRNEDYQRVLCTLAGQGEGPGAAAGEGKGSTEKALVAHMQGEVTLAGAGFDVHLVGGRFCGLSRRGVRVTPAIPAASYLVVRGRRLSFRTRSSISFEGDSGTGLREDLSLEGPYGGRLVLEYTFSGDLPELLVSGSIRYPAFPRGALVTECTPLAFPLAEMQRGSLPEVAVRCPDGSSAVYRVRERVGWQPVPGMEWTVEGRGGPVRLHTAPGEEKRWGLCFFRATPRGGKLLLEANPFGNPRPADGEGLGGTVEPFSLLISAAPDPADGKAV